MRKGSCSPNERRAFPPNVEGGALHADMVSSTEGLTISGNEAGEIDIASDEKLGF